jgi:beta-phosphoglucomutase
MNPMDAILVDLDGTLVETAQANYEAYAAALREAGVAVARKRFDAVSSGRNWRQFLPGLLEGTGAFAPGVAARKAELYPSFLHLTVLNEGVRRLIVASRPHWRCALVTTASRPNAEAILAYHRLEGLFDEIITGSDVTRHKPDPEAYRLAAERLGVAPARCVALEVSETGAASARAFGAAVIRVQPLAAA